MWWFGLVVWGSWKWMFFLTNIEITGGLEKLVAPIKYPGKRPQTVCS
jgi:hypothetical protein